MFDLAAVGVIIGLLYLLIKVAVNNESLYPFSKWETNE